jgi:hypothetical protein
MSFYTPGLFSPLFNRTIYKKLIDIIILKMLKKLKSEVLPDPRERRLTDQSATRKAGSETSQRDRRSPILG